MTGIARLSGSTGAELRGRRRMWAATGLLLAAAAGIFAWNIARTWPFFADDAFITLRYGKHLAQGRGPNFNPDPPRAEGYTSFAWVAAAALFHLAPVNPVASIKLAGLLLGIGLHGLLFVAARRWAGGAAAPTAAALAVFMLAAFHPTSVHAVSGMETMLAAVMVLVLAMLANAPERPGSAVAAPLAALLLSLTRPEGNLAAAAALAWLVGTTDKNRRRRTAGLAGLLYILPGAAYFCWRTQYYGHLLPLPFHIKVAAPGLLAGWESALSLGQMLLIHAGLPAAALVVRPVRSARLPALIAAVWFVSYLFPSPVMDFQWRFAYPAVPLIFALAGCGAAAWLDPWTMLPSWRRTALLPLAAAVCLYAGFAKSAGAELRDRRAYGLALANAHVRLGTILGAYRAAGPQRPALAIGDAGAVPYYSDWRVIDTCGLNEPEIGIARNHDPAYVLAQRPDLVIAVSRRQMQYEAHPSFPWENRLVASCLAAGMMRLAVVSFSAESHLWILGRPDTDLAAYLGGELRKLPGARPAPPVQ